MESFEKSLTRISPDEKLILQCLSLFWGNLSRQDYLVLTKQLNLRTFEGRNYSNEYLIYQLKSLLRKGLLSEVAARYTSDLQITDAGLREHLTRTAFEEDWCNDIVEFIQTKFSTTGILNWQLEKIQIKDRILRDLRLSVYQMDLDAYNRTRRQLRSHEAEDEAHEILFQVFSNPFQTDFLNRFDRNFQVEILLSILAKSIEKSRSTKEVWDFVSEHDLTVAAFDSIKVDELLFKGDLENAADLATPPDSIRKMLVCAVIALLKGDYEASTAFFEMSVKSWRKSIGKRKGFPEVWQMLLYGLALYKSDEPGFYSFAAEFYDFGLKKHANTSVCRAVKALEHFLKNNDAQAQIEAEQISSGKLNHKIVSGLITALIPTLDVPEFAADFAAVNLEIGNDWLALEFYNLLETRNSDTNGIAGMLKEKLGFEPAGNLIPPIEDWQRVLNCLSRVAEGIGDQKDQKDQVNQTRVAWRLDFTQCEVQPIEQTYSKNGWTRGRNIAIRRLFERDVDNLTPQDNKVVKNALSAGSTNSGYRSDFYFFDWEGAVSALAGHPFLFSGKHPQIHIQLTKSEPALVVREINSDLELSFDTEFAEPGSVVQKETENRYKVVVVSPHHVEIAGSLQNNRLRIPERGRDELVKAIGPLSTKIAIHSDLEEHYENLPLIDADERIFALITPVGEGFHLEFFVKPFGISPPYFKPGRGPESVVAEMDGLRTRTKRDLKNERALLDEIESQCPYLAAFESPNYEWNLPDPEACLNVLIEIENPREEGKLAIEWTKGKQLTLIGNINQQNFSLNVKSDNNWFEVSGDAKINEGLVLSLRELTGLLDQNTTNFIELSDGQFVSITEKLRKHLQSLGSILDKKQQLHPLRSGILEDFAAELEDFTGDEGWRAHLSGIRDSQTFEPELPRTFEAEFRPYQTEGYFWLSRLANWGVGACLADDMGLGKTLMALAVLVERAEKGPALVVAPVSVCRNWLQEARRFSPTLNFQLFGDGDRESALADLGKYDVLVVSYNLIQSEEEMFVKKNFATIVLDEAQAIKNRTTKRSKAVMALQGDFRMVTTGTPIENHLGELWNIFNFINPGLLGGHDFFNEKFAMPIERKKDDDVRKTLQRLIKPFVLRRRKNQVLDDLPEKTEITLTVELSEEERAFYEAIRRDALEKFANQDLKNKHFQIFAELMRLRLACCHPKLVDKGTGISSSKLELFGEVLEELLDNSHRALVFSQFVKHLGIIEEYLKAKGIGYHYLDGSTRPQLRQDRIDAFQRGEHEVFLISLKAGGTGLNLTAADYVIHLDPWWNPAVEDQATDRVHRIGQHRPVTVYRLVTENTVEEKILKLHATKRDLADSLLDGTDSSGKLSAEDLLDLIREV